MYTNNSIMSMRITMLYIASYVTISNIGSANCLRDTRSDECSCSDNINNNVTSGDNDGADIALAVTGLVISVGISTVLAKELNNMLLLMCILCSYCYVPVYSYS